MVQSVEADEVTVKLMHPRGGPRKSFKWRAIDDIWSVPISNILCIISPTTPTGRTYTVTTEEYEQTIVALEWHKNNKNRV